MSDNNYLGLHNLEAPRGARKKPKRVGRGEASGLGKTSGRGHKGQKARKSGHIRPGFEGGTLPLARRLPKRGFNNKKFATVYRAINVGLLNERFDADAVVDPSALVATGLLPNLKHRVKILGNGDLDKKLHLKVHAVSKSAQAKVEGAGGSVEVLNIKKQSAPAS
jgi:large subunit ribosomal protein L15